MNINNKIVYVVFVIAYACCNFAYSNIAYAELIYKRNIVTEIVKSNEVDKRLDSVWLDIVSCGALDIKICGDTNTEVQKNQKVSAESERTDKQTGASSSSAGAASLITKAGISELLSFAVEQGAAEKTSNVTSVTLRTTPYLVMTKLGKEDTAQNYQDYGWARRVAFYSSTPVSGNDKEFNVKNVVDYGVRLNLYGDRSTRSKAFAELWDSRVKPLEVDALISLVAVQSRILAGDGVVKLIGDAKINLIKSIDAYLKETKDSEDDKTTKILTMVNDSVEILVRQPEVMTAIQNISASDKKALLENQSSKNKKIQEELTKIITEISGSSLITLEYINQLKQNSSDVSNFNLIFQKSFFGNLDFIANAKASIYNERNKSTKKSTLKDYSGTLSLEGKMENILLSSSDETDKSKLTFSGSGGITHVEDIPGIRGTAQLRIEIPLRKGITIPLALTFASKTDTSNKAEFKGNLGLTFDLSGVTASASKF
jgi:hypothetical protein